MNCFIYLLATTIALTTAARAEARLWTSINGNQLEAEIVRFDRENITLRAKDGRIIQSPMDMLSQEDVIFALTQQPANYGAFGFPQDDAEVLCDNRILKLSVANDVTNLYVQAILWDDAENKETEKPVYVRDSSTAEKRIDQYKLLGDHSTLYFELDGDGHVTPIIKRKYSLNPWSNRKGLWYQIHVTSNSSTTLKGDSKGTGGIDHVNTIEGKTVRIDSFVIPLEDLNAWEGDEIKMLYVGYSQEPDEQYSTVGKFTGENYFFSSVDRDKYSPYTIKDSTEAYALKGPAWQMAEFNQPDTPPTP